jgi:hypothetical protein
MAQERIHVVTHENGWAVKREGKTDAESVHATQKEAIDAGRELAVKSEADLVVHRADGTFRKVYSVTGEGVEEMSDRNNGRDADDRRRTVETSDVVSVGSRISWGAVLAGAAVALALMVALGVLLTAIGLSVRDAMSDRSNFIMAMICSIVTLLAALFVGGFVVSRITAGEDKTEAITYGVVLWGVLFVAAAALSATGVNIGMQAVNVGTSPRADAWLSEVYDRAGIEQDVRTKLGKAAEEVRGQVDPKEVAWWTFGGILLSIAAAVAGSVAGAGPTLVLRALRDRRPVVTPERARVQPEPAAR